MKTIINSFFFTIIRLVIKRKKVKFPDIYLYKIRLWFNLESCKNYDSSR